VQADNGGERNKGPAVIDVVEESGARPGSEEVEGNKERMGRNIGKVYLVTEKTPIFGCVVGQNSNNPDCTHARCVNCYVEVGRKRRDKKRKRWGCCHDMAVLERYWESAYFNKENYRLNEDKHMPTECAICAVEFYDKQPEGQELCDNGG
jgi:hypothetical protein